MRASCRSDYGRNTCDMVLQSLLFHEDVLVRQSAVSTLETIFQDSFADCWQVVHDKCIDDIDRKIHCRMNTRDDRKDVWTEASLGYPDAEGWGSLETSVSAFRLILAYSPSISRDQLDKNVEMVVQLTGHTNRFVRENGQYCLSELLRLAYTHYAIIPGKLDRLFECVAIGMEDSWSQVRFAALTACRTICRLSCVCKSYSLISSGNLLPSLLLNRHFVAEGVKRHAQDTWREFVGPQGGRRIIWAARRTIFAYLRECCNSSNHSAREGAVSCTLEICTKVPGNTEIFDDSDYAIVFSIAVAALEDDAWPIRDVGCRVLIFLLSTTFDNFSIELRQITFFAKADHISNLLMRDVVHAIKCMRESACSAYALLLKRLIGLESSERCGNELWTETLRVLQQLLVQRPPVLNDSKYSRIRRVDGDAMVEDRPMYSCGSLLSQADFRKTQHTHSTSDDCCNAGSIGSSDIASTRPEDALDGAIALYFALSKSIRNKSVNVDQLHELFFSNIRDLLEGLPPWSTSVVEHISSEMEDQSYIDSLGSKAYLMLNLAPSLNVSGIQKNGFSITTGKHTYS